MPSPIAHSAVAFLFWPALRSRGASAGLMPSRPDRVRRVVLLGGVLFMLNAPDIDFLPQLVLGEGSGVVHGGPTHSLAAGLVAAVLFSIAMQAFTRAGALRLALVGLLAWWSHVLMDYLTYRGGVALLWPFTSERFSSPIPLFYGVRHSEPWAWHLHLITIVTETMFVILVWFISSARSRLLRANGADRPRSRSFVSSALRPIWSSRTAQKGLLGR